MSKIGKQPIDLPQGVTVITEGRKLAVKGAKGELTFDLPRGIDVEVSDNIIRVIPKKETDRLRALHGTVRSHVANMVRGVTEGWTKNLELVGTGYRADTTGKILNLTVGFSHPIKVDAPDGITFNVQKSDISVEGIDKVVVGQTAASIRAVRPPEPYKGKGIRYKDEVVRRKPGKAAKAGAA
jgi:large subunit ribosomal protein L6